MMPEVTESGTSPFNSPAAIEKEVVGEASATQTIREKRNRSTICSLGDTSSAEEATVRGLAERAIRLFAAFRKTTFEDGMESEFSRAVEWYIREWHQCGVTALGRVILASGANPRVAAEALIWLGKIEHSETRAGRIWLLERALQSQSAQMRDAAALGLASIDDPHAIPALQAAIRNEQIPDLRSSFEMVLEQLEATRQCLSCYA